MTTDTTEKGLESLIVAAMTGATDLSPCPPDEVCEPPLPFQVPSWIQETAGTTTGDTPST